MSVTIDGTNGINSSGSFYGQSTYTGSYTDGIVVDYTTGTGRVTVGSSDGFKIRNGGTSSPVDLMSIDSSGRIGFQGAMSTYGAVTFTGAKNGWSGINFNSSAGTNVGTLMIADGYGGFFNAADNDWLGYFSVTGLVLGSATLAKPSGSAPMYTCRAWVNFNGTGTVAINASGNVSSITDNGTGDYTVNITTALSDANYCVTTTAQVIADQGSSYQFGLRTTTNTSTAPTTKTTTAVRLLSRRDSDVDLQNCNVAIFR